MSSGNENSVEHINQKIELKKENLKFLNSFYLPLYSGIIWLAANNNPLSSKKNAEFFFLGFIALGVIFLKKRKVLKEIDLLIKKL